MDPTKNKKMNELFAASKSALLALPAEQLVRPRIPRDRVIALTSTLQQEVQPLLPRFAEELSPASAAARQADYDALDARALVYYAADLAVESPWSSDQKARRAEIAARVREHDETLSGWAIPLFRKDPDVSALVADIVKGRGVRDDAEDTLRLVALFRSHWDVIEGQVPVTKAQLGKAEADATELVKLLDGVEESGTGSPRDLRQRAFTWWLQAYTEVYHLGRYLLRDDPQAAARLPAVAPERTAPEKPAPTQPEPSPQVATPAASDATPPAATEGTPA